MKPLPAYVKRIRSLRPGRWTLSLTLKLTLGFAFVLLIFTAVSVFSTLRLEQMQAKDAVLRALSERKEVALELRSLVERMDSLASGYMISGKPDLQSQYLESISELTRLTESVGASAETKDQRNWRARLTMVSQEFVANFERTAAIVADASVAPADKQPQIAAAFNASQIHKQVIFELVQSFYDDYSLAESEAREQYTYLVGETRTVMLWANVAAVAIVIAVAAVAVRSLTAGVRQLRYGIERVKTGDLSRMISARSKDELGVLSDDFDAGVAAVRGMLAQTKRIAESLQEHSRHFRAFASSTKETNASIVLAMEEIAAGASRQAEQSDESVKTIQELEERMDGILSSAQVLLDTSFRAKDSVRDGSATAAGLSESSVRAGRALRSMSEALRRLEGRTAEISGLTNAIHNISQQTNILALNASIEAARAGVHGRGFSVIAEEVRQLSLQTTEASRRIDETLKMLRDGVQDSAETLASTADSFTEQQDKVSEAGEAFRSIVQLIDVFDDEIRRIGDRAKEAKAKQLELVEAVQVVASVAQQAAAGVEETVAAATTQDEAIGRIASESQDMNELAESLFGEIDKFRV